MFVSRKENKIQKLGEMMSEYNRLNHCKFLIQYHIIWCPKFRFNVLNEKIELELRGILRIISERYGYEIKEMEIMP
ncbi:transposase, partial [Aquibacillus koreensis]